MKLIFAGTPDFAVPSLTALREKYGKDLVAVVTQPDRPQGRKGIIAPSPVKAAAEALGIPVLQPEKIRGETDALSAFSAEVMVTCAYGQILTQEVLDLFPKGVWNIHASLLPAYRGAAPIARALIDGCRETGVTVMKTELGLDTGDMLLKATTPVYDSDTRDTLEERLSRLGAELIVSAAEMIERGELPLERQGEGFSCKKVGRTEVDFSATAREVSCLIRGLSPSPFAYARIGGLVLNFWFAEELPCDDDVPAGTVLAASPKEGFVVKCGKGAVSVTELQPAGGRRMSARDFVNGRKIQAGQRFDQPVL